MIKKKRPRCRLRTAKVRQKSFVKRLLFYVAFFLFSGLVIWIFLFSNLLEVKKIKLTGDSQEQNEIKNFIQQQLAGNSASSIFKNNLILVNTDHLEREVRENFHLLKNVNIRKVFPDTLKVETVARSDQFIFCTNQQCYLVDDSGEAYHQLEEQEQVSVQGQLVKIVLEQERDIEPGERLMEPERTEFYSELAQALSAEEALRAERTFTIHFLAAQEVEVKTKDGWSIFFSAVDPVKQQMVVLKKILEKEIKNNCGKLEYIDLRVKGKAFYRLKGEQIERVEGEQENKAGD